jgi:type IV secretory pathway VirB2 component (pilin)
MKAHTARPSRATEPPLARFLNVAPGPFGIVLSLVFVVAVGAVDYFTGTGISLAPF